jgi:hypothetical protein
MEIEAKQLRLSEPPGRWAPPNETELLRQRRLVGAVRRLTCVGAKSRLSPDCRPAPSGSRAPPACPSLGGFAQLRFVRPEQRLKDHNRTARTTRIAGICFVCLGALFAGIVYVKHSMGYPTTFRFGYMSPIQGYIGSIMIMMLGVYCIWRGGNSAKQ